MSTKIFTKDPDSRLDYQLNYYSWLNGDSISTSTWIIGSGITQSTGSYVPVYTGTTATIWLEGGTTDTNYDITNRITTAAGRIYDYSFIIRVMAL